ncbi:NAD(P)-binding protein [Cadophora sp. DSE1049]|nr:NAD(P)-binding protein [Cadophora sp. DSE1049]
MSIIAVAGGTGKLGRAIVDGINAAGKFEIVVLARQSKEIGARIIAVDYSNPEVIASVLEQNSIGTVISALSSQSPAELELNLIKGADKSSVTERYIPSIWGVRCTQEVASYFPPTAVKLGYLKAMEATSLEWTAVLNGFFLDYYGAPKVTTYMPPLALFIDLQSKFVAIPASGDVPVVFTHTFDIGKFVAALLTKDKWEKESYIIGDKVTLNDFVQIAESVTGTKFTIKHDPIEKLQTGQITELPSHPSIYAFYPKEMLQGMFSAFGIMFENGIFDLKPSHTLNEEFHNIKPMTVKELIFEVYGA